MPPRTPPWVPPPMPMRRPTERAIRTGDRLMSSTPSSDPASKSLRNARRAFAWAVPALTSAALAAVVALAAQPPQDDEAVQRPETGVDAPADANGNPLAGDDNGEGVYVKDSSLALEKFQSGKTK